MPERSLPQQGIHVTRYDETDSGTEIRVEVTLRGKTVELCVTDGMFGHEVSLWLLSDNEDRRYEGGRSLCEARLDTPPASTGTQERP